MYMPAAMLGRMTGIAPEFIVIVLVIAEISGALFVIDRAAAAAKLGARERSLSTWSFAFLLAILPGTIFGQREHIAVIALTPLSPSPRCAGAGSIPDGSRSSLA